MTDEQILKRLAEIEGISWNPYFNAPAFKGATGQNVVHRERYSPNWNPLHDWSDLGPLIEKYKVWLSYNDRDDEWCGRPHYAHPPWKWHESPFHAICLAIIEANGGMGDE